MLCWSDLPSNFSKLNSLEELYAPTACTARYLFTSIFLHFNWNRCLRLPTRPWKFLSFRAIASLDYPLLFSPLQFFPPLLSMFHCDFTILSVSRSFLEASLN